MTKQQLYWGGVILGVMVGIAVVASSLALRLALAPVPDTAPTTTDHTAWFAARAAGILAYLVLWVTVVLGLGVQTRGFGQRLARASVFELHRFLSLFGIGLMLGHVLLLLPDQYFQFWPDELFIPFFSPFRPIQTALGVFGLYLIGLLTASFWLRQRLGYRWWRKFHYLTFLAYALVLGHGLTTGSDTGQPWMVAIYASTTGAVLLLALYRLRARRPHPPAPRRAERLAEPRTLAAAGPVRSREVAVRSAGSRPERDQWGGTA